jgi:hypothetical protein
MSDPFFREGGIIRPARINNEGILEPCTIPGSYVGGVFNNIRIQNNITNSATASGLSSASIGKTTTASGDYSTALGANNTSATGESSTSVGSACVASGAGSTAFGVSATASADGATALGNTATASAESATAVGSNARATNNYAVAVGSGLASGQYAVAIGNGNTASGENAVSIGTGRAAGTNAVNVGFGNADGENSVSIGPNARCSAAASNSISFGTNSQCTVPDTINLGLTSTPMSATVVSQGLLIDPTGFYVTSGIAITGQTTTTYGVTGTIGAAQFCPDATISSSAVGAIDLTLPTVANVLLSYAGLESESAYWVHVSVPAASGAITLLTNTGWTLVGDMTIASNTGALLLCRIDSLVSQTATLYRF